MAIFKGSIVAVLLAFAASTFAVPAQTTSTTLGKADAPAGGTFYKTLNSEPEKLNPITSTDHYASIVQSFVVDRLMALDPETYEFVPALAESFKADKSGKWYTFTIREGVKWSDGKPLTIEDVKFSFDVIRNPKYETAHQRPYFENVKEAIVVDKKTIKFLIKKKYFNNFAVLAGLQVVPKHVYGDPSKKKGKILIGSGPYKIGKYKKGKSLTLVRNSDWWGYKVPYFAGAYKPQKVFYRFVKEENVQMEMLKKGKIDLLSMSADQYKKKAVGPKWGKKVFKKQVENSMPKGYGFVAWNFKNDLFKDRKVRIALAHLMNREMMNKKFRHGMSMLATGPWYQQSPYANKKTKPFGFDMKKAGQLLKQAGWADSDKDGVLDKMINGKKKKFSFNLMFSNKDAEKYFTMYREDLKKAGIDMQLKRIEWNSFVKALNDRKFDAVALAWSAGSIDNDPKQIWHSESARKGGSNFNSYKNAAVDKLIDKGRQELDRNKRIKIYNKIYEKIAADAPYAFMFNEKYVLYGHTKKMKYVKDTMKYDVGSNFWWIEK